MCIPKPDWGNFGIEGASHTLKRAHLVILQIAMYCYMFGAGLHDGAITEVLVDAGNITAACSCARNSERLLVHSIYGKYLVNFYLRLTSVSCTNFVEYDVT